MENKAKSILDFWFIESSPEELFKKNEVFDQKIRDRFFTDYQNAIQNKYDDWQDHPKTCISLIIVLDQFSRNLFRNDKRSFDQDQKSRLIVNEAIDRNYLEELSLKERLFMLLPLIHSEDMSDHIYGHNLCDTYLKDDENFKMIKKIWNDHTVIIKKFSRYPHRNFILNRQSSEQEVLFLQQPNSSW